jgi:hypothetical protein
MLWIYIYYVADLLCDVEILEHFFYLHRLLILRLYTRLHALVRSITCCRHYWRSRRKRVVTNVGKSFLAIGINLGHKRRC